MIIPLFILSGEGEKGMLAGRIEHRYSVWGISSLPLYAILSVSLFINPFDWRIEGGMWVLEVIPN